MTTRILAFAYACEPDKGSEPGAGWAWVRMLGELGETTVITRANNAVAIESALAEVSTRYGLRFVYVDLPAWARFWKRKQRGLRLYYLLWQYAALREARRIVAATDFDLVWHLTLANVWLGSLGYKVGLPFVYGPVGGGVRIPRSLWCALGPQGIAYEALREVTRFVARYLNPFARAAWRNADLILVQNPETRRWLPARHRHKASTFCNAVVEEIVEKEPPRGRSGQTALFAARLLAWKGAALAVQAVTHAPGWTLLICGDGPDKRRLEQMVAGLAVGDRVHLLGALDRGEVLRAMEEADVFLFPSLHDDSPLAVTEAISRGLPVVCLNRGGPPVLAGSAGVILPIEGDCRKVSKRLAERGLTTKLPSRREVLKRAEELSFDATIKRIEALVKAVIGKSIPVTRERDRY